MSDRTHPHSGSPAEAPLVDRVGESAVYSPAIAKGCVAGAVVGVLALGIPAHLVVLGTWPIAHLGQFVSSGPAVATFVGAGLGAAVGGLVGALIAVFRLPRRGVSATDH